MRKFCELNVKVSPFLQQNVDNVKQLIELGYQTVAINFLHAEPIKQKKDEKMNPNDYIQKKNNLLNHVNNALKQLQELTNEFKIPDDFRLLSRINFEISTPDHIRCMRGGYYAEILKQFDLISLNPQNEKVFRMIMDGKINTDIVSFHLQNDFEYRLTNEIVSVGVKRGIYFEVCYSPMINSQTLRKYIIKNGRLLVSKIKRSKGVILSSGGECVMDFRSPTDVVNMADLFSIKGESCYDVVEANCQRAINHSLTRRKTFHGAVMVEKIEKMEKMGESLKSEEPNIKKVKIDIES